MIKAKTSSIDNNKQNASKSSVKQVSIITTGANKEKKIDNSIEMTNASKINDSTHDNNIFSSLSATPNLSGFNVLKTDLPGRVSFSKNDVYEIDYSDIDNDTDTSRSFDFNEPFRKKNVHFEDDYSGKYGNTREKKIFSFNGESSNHMVSPNRHQDSNDDIQSSDDTKYFASLASNSLRSKTELSTRLDVLPEDNENGNTATDNDNSDKIIEDYKREIENINRKHEMELKWNDSSTASFNEYLPSNAISKDIATANATSVEESNECNSGSGDSWSSPNHGIDKCSINTPKTNIISNTSDESPTRDSTSTVINNYLKITNQKTNSTSKPSSATIKLKTTKKLSTNGNHRISKSAQAQNTDSKPNSSNRIMKAKSVGQLHRVADIKLSEFQIDKVESWMSTHEDTFSDAGLNSYRKHGKFGSTSNLDYKKAWRETPLSKTDDEGNYSLDDQVDNTSADGSTSGEIELVLRKLEGRRMKISFGKFLIFNLKSAENVMEMLILIFQC